MIEPRRTADPDIPYPDQRFERAELIEKPDEADGVIGQRASASHRPQAGHMTAIAKETSPKKELAKGPSTYGRGCEARSGAVQ